MKALQTMMDDLEKGDEVVAAGGIIGRIKEIKGPYVSIEVSENITFKLQKTAIANTLPKGHYCLNRLIISMNRFSIGTHAFILIVLAVGIIYSLPNLYPAKPAIQIAYTDSGQSADQGLLNEVTEILSAKSIESESIGLKDNNIVAKFSSFDDQLAA